MPYKDPERAKRAQRDRYLRNQTERIEYARRQRAERGDEINARRRELRAQKPAEWHAAYLEYQRAWHDVRPGYAREASRKRRAEHPEDLIYFSQWRQMNREAVRAYANRHRGNAMAGMTKQDKAESIEWRKLIAGDPCFYCGTSDAQAYEDDHYVSIANGGTDHWWNLVRACQDCNRAKSAMNGDEFLALHAA